MLITILIFFLVIFILLTVVLYKILLIQLKKVNSYESIVSDYISYVSGIKNYVTNTYLKMKSIDEKEIFSKDDEVGVIFNELLELINNLNNKLQ